LTAKRLRKRSRQLSVIHCGIEWITRNGENYLRPPRDYRAEEFPTFRFTNFDFADNRLRIIKHNSCLLLFEFREAYKPHTI
jgi:hypothetical protein